MKKNKLLVIGHARHGKDTFCEILRDTYGYNFISSSQFCAELFIYQELSPLYGYTSVEDCYADRFHHRAEWYDLISDYCREDPALLGKQIFEKYDIYCGLRNVREYQALREQQVFDICVWVDRSQHLPLEPSASMTLKKEHADYIIDNNGSLDDLNFKIKTFIENI